MSCFTENYPRYGIRENAANIIMSLWRPNTKTKYQVYLKQWDLLERAKKQPETRYRRLSF